MVFEPYEVTAHDGSKIMSDKSRLGGGPTRHFPTRAKAARATRDAQARESYRFPPPRSTPRAW
jgi:hypothetical protein